MDNNSKKKCPYCSGGFIVTGVGRKPCPYCKGTGYVDDDNSSNNSNQQTKNDIKWHYLLLPAILTVLLFYLFNEGTINFSEDKYSILGIIGTIILMTYAAFKEK